jgi:hypothetical protein
MFMNGFAPSELAKTLLFSVVKKEKALSHFETGL